MLFRNSIVVWIPSYEIMKSGKAYIFHIDGLIKKRHNSISNTLELCLFSIKPKYLFIYQGPHVLTWFNFNLSMDKQLYLL